MLEEKPGPGRIRAGPGKEPLKGPRLPQYSTHKIRAGWFQARTALAPDADIHHLISQRKAAPPAPGYDWEFVGPSNIGGRATAVATHPAVPDLVYLGTANGGVWSSRDAGRHWIPLWRFEDVLSIGSLAIDPANPDILYAGTGEANLSGDNYPGVGIFLSTDGGLTWSLFAPVTDNPLPQRIGVIAIDPSDSRHILIGGVGLTGEKPGGLCFTRDAGATWMREPVFGTGDYRCHAVVFHPEGRIVYTAIDARGPMSGIWRSEDAGATWKQLSEGLPPSDLFGRISVAICAAKPQYLYALAADRRSGVLGLFRTINGGEIWSAVGWEYFDRESQMSYNNCIAVHPSDPDLVFCGGVDLHRSVDGGKSWAQATDWAAVRGNEGYAHADHHAIAIPATNHDLVYDANDGGVDFSTDRGITWANRSDTLGDTQFYSLDVAQSDGNCLGGGTQDNGSLLTETGRPDRFFQVLGGDGGFMAIDPTDAAHIYASYQHLNVFRHREDEGWTRVTPAEADAGERAAVWMARIAIDPRCPTTVFTATNRVWRTRNDGETWTPVSPNLDNSEVSAIEIAKANSRIIYVGTTGGGVYKSTDGGNSWSQNIAGTLLPAKIITAIAADPANPEVVFVSAGGARVSPAYSHVFRSLDGGKTWEDADRGRLPNVPHHALVFQDTEEPYLLFAANDVGVFQSTDRGETWVNISGNLPHVMVTDLAYHTQDRTLTAGTYGRGLWRLRVG